jgi:hypothetical protein
MVGAEIQTECPRHQASPRATMKLHLKCAAVHSDGRTTHSFREIDERGVADVAIERFPIEAGHIMMFARAIADPNPVYSDAEYAATTEVGGVIAPPTFVFAGAQYDDDHPLRPRIGRPWMGSGRDATQVTPTEGERSTGRGLHAEQHFEYHRPLLAGEVLRSTVIPGKTWEKEGRRGGSLKFSETITEYRTLGGELVVTARMVGVLTGQAVAPAGEG